MNLAEAIVSSFCHGDGFATHSLYAVSPSLVIRMSNAFFAVSTPKLVSKGVTRGRLTSRSSISSTGLRSVAVVSKVPFDGYEATSTVVSFSDVRNLLMGL